MDRPPKLPSCLISGLSMVYGRYNYGQWMWMRFINQLITEGHHPVKWQQFQELPQEMYGKPWFPASFVFKVDRMRILPSCWHFPLRCVPVSCGRYHAGNSRSCGAMENAVFFWMIYICKMLDLSSSRFGANYLYGHPAKKSIWRAYSMVKIENSMEK